METLYDAVGGEPVFRQLVDRFYDGVALDPILRPLYPDEDLTGARDRLALFLMQYWGGPTTYSDDRGHPRLRMRHSGWVIGPRERDAWLTHMNRAILEIDVTEQAREMIWEHVARAAETLVNAPQGG